MAAPSANRHCGLNMQNTASATDCISYSACSKVINHPVVWSSIYSGTKYQSYEVKGIILTWALMKTCQTSCHGWHKHIHFQRFYRSASGNDSAPIFWCNAGTKVITLVAGLMWLISLEWFSKSTACCLRTSLLWFSSLQVPLANIKYLGTVQYTRDSLIRWIFLWSNSCWWPKRSPKPIP